MKKTLMATAIAATLISGNVLAELSTNVGATTNYLWRGVTQSADTASVSGGIDWSDESGLYAGAWIGSLIFAFPADDTGADLGVDLATGSETDLYVGFAGEAGSVGYDVGVITYQYSLGPEYNFTEAYVNVSVADFTVGLASTVAAAHGNEDGVFDKGDMYVSASYGFTAGKFDVSVFGGSYMFENDELLGGTADYNHYGVSFGSGEVTVALEKNDIEGGNADNVRVVASWSKGWDL